MFAACDTFSMKEENKESPKILTLELRDDTDDTKRASFALGESFYVHFLIRDMEKDLSKIEIARATTVDGVKSSTTETLTVDPQEYEEDYYAHGIDGVGV